MDLDCILSLITPKCYAQADYGAFELSVVSYTVANNMAEIHMAGTTPSAGQISRVYCMHQDVEFVSAPISANLDAGIPIYASIKATFSVRPNGTISLVANDWCMCSGGKCTVYTFVGNVNYLVTSMPVLANISGCVEIDGTTYCDTVVELPAGLHRVKTVTYALIDVGLKIELELPKII